MLDRRRECGGAALGNAGISALEKNASMKPSLPTLSLRVRPSALPSRSASSVETRVSAEAAPPPYRSRTSDPCAVDGGRVNGTSARNSADDPSDASDAKLGGGRRTEGCMSARAERTRRMDPRMDGPPPAAPPAPPAPATKLLTSCVARAASA